MDPVSPTDDLTTVALKVATALSIAGTAPVLTGGSAATVYAADAYQSRDLDFVLRSAKDLKEPEQALAELGFQPNGRVYSSPNTNLTVDLLPEDEVRIGSEGVHEFSEIQRGELSLTLLNPTDCVRDRLAGFYWFRDRSSLDTALAVASRHHVNLPRIREWSESEGEMARFEEFRRLLEHRTYLH